MLAAAAPVGWTEVAGRPRTTVAVRPARAADAAALMRIGIRGFRMAHREAMSFETATRQVTRAFRVPTIRRDALDPDVTLLVAEVEGTVRGFARLAVLPPPGTAHAAPAVCLDRLYVDPDRIGRGTGSALMARALGTSREDGFRAMWLRAWAGNAPAIRFYRHWGFTGIGRESVRVQDTDVDTLLMGRLLS